MSSVEIYKIFSSKKDFSDEEAQFIAGAMELKDSVATKEDIARLQGATKEDIARLQGATKEDIARLEGTTRKDIADLRTEFKVDIGKLDKKMTILWLITIAAIVFTNPRALDLVQRLCGMAK